MLTVRYSELKLCMILFLCFLWAQQGISISFFGGNLRFGFAVLLTLSIWYNAKINIYALGIVIYVSILGLTSSLTHYESYKSIFYTILLIGNFYIYNFLYNYFKEFRVDALVNSVRYHLIFIILLLLIEDFFSNDRLHLLFKEPSYLGIYLSVFVSFSIITRDISVLILCAIIGLLSISVFSFVVLLCGLLIFFAHTLITKKLKLFQKIGLILLALIILSGLIYLGHSNRYTASLFRLFSNFTVAEIVQFLVERGGSRIDRMLSAFHYFWFETTWVLGSGPGTFIDLNNPIKNPTYSQVNSTQPGFSGSAINIFVEFLVEYGILAMLGLTAIIYRSRTFIFNLALLPIFICMFLESSYLRPAFWFGIPFLLCCYNSMNLHRD